MMPEIKRFKMFRHLGQMHIYDGLPSRLKE
jgi:hypothetical protein